MRMPIRLSLAKTASFAVLHFTVAFVIAYLLTGSIGIASALALVEPLANTVAFFFHERVWARVASGAMTSAVPSERSAASVASVAGAASCCAPATSFASASK